MGTAAILVTGAWPLIQISYSPLTEQAPHGNWWKVVLTAISGENIIKYFKILYMYTALEQR